MRVCARSSLTSDRLEEGIVYDEEKSSDETSQQSQASKHLSTSLLRPPRNNCHLFCHFYRNKIQTRIKMRFMLLPSALAIVASFLPLVASEPLVVKSDCGAEVSVDFGVTRISP